MARLNLEDSLFTQSNFLELIEIVGNRYTATGIIVLLFSEAQRYWVKDKSLIPKQKMKRHPFLKELIELDFIAEEPHGYYVRGSKKQFSWLVQKVEAGKKSGLARKKGTSNKNSNLEANGRSTESNGKGTALNGSEPLTLTPTLTLSKNKNPLKGESARKKQTHWLVELWNQNCGKLPKCRVPISAARMKKLEVRVREESLPETWAKAITRLAASDFCNGKNDRSWVADFDFLLRPDSLAKVLEGKYDNRAGTSKNAHLLSLDFNSNNFSLGGSNEN